VTTVLSDALDRLLKYLEKQRYWKTIQPFFLTTFGTVAAEVAAYQYVKSQYNLTQVPLFLGSYISTRILVSGAAVLVLLLLFKVNPGRRNRPAPSRLVALYRANRTTILYRGLLIATVAVASGLVFFATSPTRASRITIRFFDLPSDVRSEAFTYLVYEINRIQRQWYFDIDARPFNTLELSPAEYNACNPEGYDHVQPLLCYAERKSESQGPIILITAMPLNDAYLATHFGIASVITTADAAYVAPITNYEYLAYMTVLQSMLIQLDAQGTIPADAFVPGPTSSGGAFEFIPARDMFKAAMLAPRLSPALEGQIFNRFGPGYLEVCSQLLSLDWLYAPRVRENLSKLFGVTLSH
jgi:hypothetical protein